MMRELDLLTRPRLGLIIVEHAQLENIQMKDLGGLGRIRARRVPSDVTPCQA